MPELLSPNPKLSPYRIISHIGAGVLGEVWFAEAIRLGRKVAFKLAPERFARNEDRVSRIAQEANAVRAFNHPNGATRNNDVMGITS
jgi:serine/threonine protein kinase